MADASKPKKASPFSKLFRGKDKESKVPENTGPLQQDQAQAQLVAAAKAKALANRASSTGIKPMKKSEASSPRGGAVSSTTPPADSDSHRTLSPPPPPLPKKLTQTEMQDFIFCVECGARNKTFRTHCVSCNEELEIPEGIQKNSPAPKAVPAKCLVTGSGVESGLQTAEGVARFTVRFRDADGKPVAASGAGRLAVQVEGPWGEIEARLKPGEGEEGSMVEAEYERRQPGSYHVMVTLDEVEVAEAPYLVEVLPVVAPELCSVAGAALQDGMPAGQAVELTVLARDVCGSLCAGGGATVMVRAVSKEEGKTIEAEAEDKENGTYEALLTYPAAGRYVVSVEVNGSPVKDSPFEVAVEKAPSAGSKWQARLEEEAAVQRRRREEERRAEMEGAKERFLAQAEQARAAAAAKEAAELAERERQRAIAAHMERMRSEEGDEVRAAVLERVRAQASDTIYEPADEETAAEGGAGKKWAAQFNQEDSRRRAAREAERQAEIGAAKERYLETATEAVQHALSKEEQQMAEEERLRRIEMHQQEVRQQRAVESGKVIQEEGNDEETAEDTGEEEVADGVVAAKSVKRNGSKDVPSVVGQSVGQNVPQDSPAPRRPIDVEAEDKSSEITPSSGASSPSASSPSSSSSSSEEEEPKGVPSVTVESAPASSTSAAAPVPAAIKSTVSPRPGGGRRGAAPEVGGRVVPYSELRNSKARWQDELDTDNLEAYLSDEEFARVMGCARDKFYQQPSWRRQQIKKEKGLD